jgi:hypothetical protein
MKIHLPLLAGMVSTAMVLGAAAPAADLPKEGTYKGAYSGYGTYKVMPVGKERVLVLWEEHGLELAEGLGDHGAVHCWGTSDYIKGVGQDQGSCVTTDPEGDQFVTANLSEKHAIDAKSFGVNIKYSGGSGKYAGISGDERDICHSGEFKTPEGTYVQYCTYEGSYKIP